MIVSLTIIRYRKLFIPFALFAMAVHRLPMMLQKGCTFWKLLGTGSSNRFAFDPNWKQWGLLAVWSERKDFDNFYTSSFVQKWWKILVAEQWTLLSIPLQSHGKWNGINPFEVDKADKNYDGPIVVITRAQIRLSKLKNFWKSVSGVSQQVDKATGHVTSIGIGESFHLAATFSVWKNAESMKAFAYASGAHSEVIKLARQEDWLKEELFARFKPVASMGTINGKDPLADITI
jgi:hypothetical protein